MNLMGVVHGLHTFLPIMLDQDQEGHDVNTSSVWGLVTRGAAPYGASKHAVMRITEGLYYDLEAAGAKVKCSVLCPGAIATQIGSSDRNRPDELRNEAGVEEQRQAERERFAAERQQRIAEAERQGLPHEPMQPDGVAELVLDAIKQERFYILTHPGIAEGVRTRMEDIIEQRNPSPQGPLDILGSRRT